jgi:hypothetical protein
MKRRTSSPQPSGRVAIDLAASTPARHHRPVSKAQTRPPSTGLFFLRCRGTRAVMSIGDKRRVEPELTPSLIVMATTASRRVSYSSSLRKRSRCTKPTGRALRTS